MSEVEITCCICLDNDVDTIYEPCMHKVVCLACSKEWEGTCPVCRSHISKVTKLETREPETREPETREPETREPETREPETREPETKEPETKEPKLEPKFDLGVLVKSLFEETNSKIRKRALKHQILGFMIKKNMSYIDCGNGKYLSVCKRRVKQPLSLSFIHNCFEKFNKTQHMNADVFCDVLNHVQKSQASIKMDLRIQSRIPLSALIHP